MVFSGFLHGSPAHQRRLLRLTADVFAVVIVVALLVQFVIRPMFDDGDAGLVAFRIDTPAVGPGISGGSPVILRGVAVGTVVAVHATGDGTQQMEVEVNEEIAGQLGSDLDVDFRPQNYFGIAALNLVPGANGTDEPLVDGTTLRRDTPDDFTMSTMIEQGSIAAEGTLQRTTTDAIRRAVAYSASLEPFVNTMVLVAESVSRTQKRLPAHIIGNLNSVLDVLPPFTDGATAGMWGIYDTDMLTASVEVQDAWADAMNKMAGNFFTIVGNLLTTNRDNLLSTVAMAEDVIEVFPALGSGILTPAGLGTLLDQLDGAFDPAPGGGRTVKLKLQLESLPGLQVPVADLASMLGGRR
ncbi:MlaD family protein [Gordonia jinghuaiqii]|uniref:MCE family protein n=1 Tax=Gordonia jinghuaiqii TaxID=2758710 RepID=A0A7D7LTD9_9ACTN|nr:MlaD family protein [Gordonia jinghuaiqii]QMT01041.1 MCE family protein [Gordonia jinghuaiqii]